MIRTCGKPALSISSESSAEALSTTMTSSVRERLCSKSDARQLRSASRVFQLTMTMDKSGESLESANSAGLFLLMLSTSLHRHGGQLFACRQSGCTLHALDQRKHKRTPPARQRKAMLGIGV